MSGNGACFDGNFTYSKQLALLSQISERYAFAQLGYIGKSLLGRHIPVLKIGEGAGKVLYVGTHHAMEWITSALLTEFAFDLCKSIAEGRKIHNLDAVYLSRARSIYIVPMLNPDGAELQMNGLEEENPMRERLWKMNRESDDFSEWQANARGVDLNHNYNAGFGEYKKMEIQNAILGPCATKFSGDAPESEPETSALCSFIRSVGDFRILLALHTQGEEIYYDYNGYVPTGGKSAAKTLSRLCGYRLAEPEGSACYGGLKDWYICEFNAPAFTIECGLGKNPLPVSNGPAIYQRLSGALFTAPILC